MTICHLTIPVFLLCFFSQFGAFCASYTWVGSNGTDYNNNLNWSPNGVPAAGDKAVFDEMAVGECISTNGFDIDSLVITTGFTSSLTLNGVTDVQDYFFVGGGSCQSNSELNINGNFEMSGGSFGLSNQEFTVLGQINASAGVLNFEGAYVECTGINIGAATFTSTTDTLRVMGGYANANPSGYDSNGGVTVLGGFATYDVTGDGSHVVFGDLIIESPGIGTYNFKDTIQANITVVKNVVVNLEKGGVLLELNTTTGAAVNSYQNVQMDNISITNGGLYIQDSSRVECNSLTISNAGALVSLKSKSQLDINGTLTVVTSLSPPFSFAGSAQHGCISIGEDYTTDMSGYSYPSKVDFCLKPGFYGEVADIQSAAQGRVQTNCSDCFFHCTNSQLTGVITDGINPYTAGEVQLVRNLNVKMWNEELVAPINTLGEYAFADIETGDYLFRMVPDTLVDADAIPTYYPNEMVWDSGLSVSVTCGDTSTHDAQMTRLVPLTGTGSISGKIYQSLTGKTTEDPIPGLDIVLEKTPPANVVAHTTTDPLGAYEFVGLENGHYEILVDIPGLERKGTHSVDLDVGGEDSFTNLDFYADSTDAIYPFAVITYVEQAAHAGRIWQQRRHELKITRPYELAAVEVFDLSGRRVYQAQSGQNGFHLPVELEGIYLVQLNVDGALYQAKILLR